MSEGVDISKELELAEKALRDGDRYSIAQLITLFEDSRPVAFDKRDAVIRFFQESGRSHRATFSGITGTPGAGKSTLVGELALRFAAADAKVRVAVLAVDPSSEVSGGSLLGDRTRVRFPVDEHRLYFRSQASDRELGGISRTTFSVCRLLYHLFDHVLIETVGIGQNEIEVQHIADRVYLVLQPLAGDQIQFMKAGIMEIPDAFVINKSDQTEPARKTYYSLKASLGFVRPGEDHLPIFRVSALTGLGLDDLSADMQANRHDLLAADAGGVRSDAELYRKEVFYFEKWVRDEYGRHGLRRLATMGGSGNYMDQHGGFDLARRQFAQLF